MARFECQVEITETYFEEEHISSSTEQEYQDINSLIEMIDSWLYSYDIENFKHDLQEVQDTSELNRENFDVGVTITIYFDDDSAVVLRIPFDFDEMALSLNRITVEGDPHDPIARSLFTQYNKKSML